MQKIVVYTTAFGDNFGVIPQRKIEGVDFYCFTENPKKVPKPWKPINIEETKLKRSRLKGRHAKLLPHRYFSDYEISIYMDSNYLIVGDIFKLIKSLGGSKMGIFDHNQCDDERNCVYDEYKAILELGESRGVFKDDPKIMKKQIEFFQNEGYPKNNGLIFSAALVRQHNDPEVIKFMEDWWAIVSTQSKRDQLSFDYIAWKNKFSFTIIPGDLRHNNPYFYFLSFNSKSYTRRLIKYKIKKMLGFTKHPISNV